MKYENSVKIEDIRKKEELKKEKFLEKCRLYEKSESFSEFSIKLDNEGKGYRFNLFNPFWWHYKQKNSCENFLNIILFITLAVSMVLTFGLIHMGFCAKYVFEYLYFPIAILTTMVLSYIDIFIFHRIEMALVHVKYET